MDDILPIDPPTDQFDCYRHKNELRLLERDENVQLILLYRQSYPRPTNLLPHKVDTELQKSDSKNHRPTLSQAKSNQEGLTGHEAAR